MAQSPAISVKNVVKTYGSRIVLDGLSMDVEEGTIYGLLGASGCGKTTLLSCVVGRKNINSGEIWILGGRPGEKGSGVPGPKVGYMPQELALVEEFTIKDAIYYFGTIFKMKPDDIKKQLLHLTKLLDLPDADKLLKHCSGGQKRRVSFAAALVHSPVLLILDEPTVGVDPVLREKIWTHLHDIVEIKRTTVIITTHYIEETRGADRIGLMRGGKLLAQESPKKLLSLFQKDTLEEVFLILCQRQTEKQLNEDSNAIKEDNRSSMETLSSSTSVESFVMGYGSRDELTKSSKGIKKTKKDQTVYMAATDLDKDRMKALLNKNWKQFYRNIGGIIFLLTFPVIQMWIFGNAIGSDPKQLKLGIINNESMTTLCTDFNWNETALYYDYDCHFRNLTCRFLTYLEHPMINKILYKSYPEAIEGIKHGEIIGVLYMPTNFSESFEERVRLGPDAQEWITNYGGISAYMDMSNRQTGAALTIKLHNLFMDFQEKLFIDCQLPKKLARVPIQKSFIYGDNDKPISIFIIPGGVLLLIFLLGSTMTSQIIVKEKIDGVWDRSIVAGVSSLEITLSHLLFQSVIVLVECSELLLMMYVLPDMDNNGSLWALFLITYLQGICGMAYGLFVSAICQNLGAANLLCTGGYLPMTLTSGVIWPIEAMPIVLKWISMFSPSTLAIISFRNVMVKGWGLWDLQVINGVGIMLGWILVFTIASVWFIKVGR